MLPDARHRSIHFRRSLRDVLRFVESGTTAQYRRSSLSRPEAPADPFALAPAHRGNETGFAAAIRHAVPFAEQPQIFSLIRATGLKIRAYRQRQERVADVSARLAHLAWKRPLEHVNLPALTFNACMPARPERPFSSPQLLSKTSTEHHQIPFETCSRCNGAPPEGRIAARSCESGCATTRHAKPASP